MALTSAYPFHHALRVGYQVLVKGHEWISYRKVTTYRLTCTNRRYTNVTRQRFRPMTMFSVSGQHGRQGPAPPAPQPSTIGLDNSTRHVQGLGPAQSSRKASQRLPSHDVCERLSQCPYDPQDPGNGRLTRKTRAAKLGNARQQHNNCMLVPNT